MDITLKQNVKLIAIIKIMSALISFCVGGLIYLAYRSTSLRMFNWINEIGFYDSMISLRKIAQHHKLNDFALYSLPDGLWVTSYILIMDTVWENNLSQQLLWCSLIPIIGVFSEILQSYNLLEGTFDYSDVLCYAFPYIIYLTLKLF